MLWLLWVPFQTWRKGAERVPVGVRCLASLFPIAYVVYKQWGESRADKGH